MTGPIHIDANGERLPQIITSKTPPIVGGMLHPTTLAQKSVGPSGVVLAQTKAKADLAIMIQNAEKAVGQAMIALKAQQ